MSARLAAIDFARFRDRQSEFLAIALAVAAIAYVGWKIGSRLSRRCSSRSTACPWAPSTRCWRWVSPSSTARSGSSTSTTAPPPPSAPTASSTCAPGRPWAGSTRSTSPSSTSRSPPSPRGWSPGPSTRGSTRGCAGATAGGHSLSPGVSSPPAREPTWASSSRVRTRSTSCSAPPSAWSWRRSSAGRSTGPRGVCSREPRRGRSSPSLRSWGLPSAPTAPSWWPTRPARAST